MTSRTHHRAQALGAAFALGVLADALLRAPGRPGLNVLIWAVAGVALLVVLRARRDTPWTGEARWFVLAALVGAASLVLRDAEALALFALLAAIVLLTLAAGRATAAWVGHSPPSAAVVAGLRVALLVAAGPLGWGRGRPADATTVPRWTGTARTLLRGALLALPALLVLGALLMSADAVFDRVVRDAFRLDLDRVVEHVLLTAVIGWFTAGYLRAFLVPDDDVLDRVRLPRLTLAVPEVTVALTLVNLLLLAFMAVQVRYLFGGADVVQLTAGLSYAAYARRGFFELVGSVAFVVPLLLAADWAAAPEPAGARRVLRGAMLVLVLLLGGVLLSAAYRMRLYQAAYGLTEQRVYVTTALVWLALVLGWLALTVVRARRERFLIGPVIAGVLCLAGLVAFDPHAMIARVNLDRAIAGAAYDGDYLRTLSADAVPTLLARIDHLPVAERCAIERRLRERWGVERPGGWRTWNRSDARARRLVAGYSGDSACVTATGSDA